VVDKGWESSMKGQKQRRDVRKWRKILADQALSGQSAAEFCGRNAISVNTFKRWRKDLELEPMASACVPKEKPKDNPFVAVNMQAVKEAAPTEAAVEILLRGGSVIKVTERTSLELLSTVLKALED
jgi:hypothetical protein